MTENEITKDILDASFQIHTRFGPGLLESVYERLLAAELRRRGHVVECQKDITFSYAGEEFRNAFRLDMLVDGKIVVELKSTEQMNPVFMKQVKTYLVILDLRVGLVVNFGMALLRDGFVRVVNNYQENQPST